VRAREAGLLAAGLVVGAFLGWTSSRPGEGDPVRRPDRTEGRPTPSAVRRGAPSAPVPPSGLDGPEGLPPEEPGVPRPAGSPGEAALRGLKVKAGLLGLEASLLAARGEIAALDAGESKAPASSPSPGKAAENLAEAERLAAPLLDGWRQAAPGAERASAMRALLGPVRRLLEAGGAAENLAVLEESAERGASAAERRWAVIATHTVSRSDVVDFLLARAASPHPEVRFYAVEGLAWVRGDDRPRAVEGVVRGLEDADPTVREIAAISLGTLVADPANAEAILARLSREDSPRAAQGMAVAVLRLDSTRGRDRVAAAAEGCPSEVREAVTEALSGPAAGKR